MKLVRAILEKVEALPYESENGFSPFEIKGYSSDELRYHVRLCNQAGLIIMAGHPFVKELTWNGHELLESFRNNTT